MLPLRRSIFSSVLPCSPPSLVCSCARDAMLAAAERISPERNPRYSK
jgi:hypothetical protein